MTKNQKRLGKIILTALLLILLVVLVPQNSWVNLASYLVVYLLIGGDILKKAFTNILHKEVFDENFLMSIATIGAFFVGQYIEGVAVMLFYQVGELFQSYAVDQSRKSIGKLMDIRPDHANLEIGGTIEVVDPDEIEIGQRILVKPGERIPLDGVIVEGRSLVDTSALTGESVPREVSAGEEVLSGCINSSAVLHIEVTKEFEDSTVNKILDLVENASSKKSKSENYITKFARYYTPIVVVLAILLAALPPLFSALTFHESLYRALTFLVISCPCALVISVPLSFFGGIGGASKLGILIKGSNYLEALAQTETVVFDKTGTLTKGVFKVQNCYVENGSKADLLKYAAYVESFSTHPISLSLQEAYGDSIDQNKIKNIEEIAGHGVKGIIFGKEVLAGNSKLMATNDISYKIPTEVGTYVHVAINGQYVGCIVIADEVKADAQEAISALKRVGVKETVMLTGDSDAVGQAVGKKLGLDKIYTQLLPEDKVNQLEALLQKKQKNEKLAFVGDGINDAPVLARADIGIAMGGLGSDAAIEAADIVIMTDEPSKIATAVELSRSTLKIVKQNILFAIVIKILFLVLGSIGLASMGAAVFADVGVTVLAVLNAMRCLRIKKFKTAKNSNLNKLKPVYEQ